MEEQIRYRLEARIGVGGMGEVFRGVACGEHGFERPVAIKRIHPRVAADKEFVGRFIREARIGGALVHPNVITVLDLARDENGDLLLVMELVDGLDLVRLSRRGALPTAAAVYIVKQVLQALRATHAQGVTHLDVTPHNVRITESGLVKLGDFGLAKAKEISWQSNHHDIRGKIGYLSPEQAQDDNIDHRADLFELGVIFYELLTGRRPYGEPRTIDEYVLRLFSITVVPPSEAAPGIPAELDTVVLTMLARTPTHRYQSAQEILDALPEQDGGKQTLAKLVAEHMAALEATIAEDSLSNAPTGLRPITVEDAVELDANDQDRAKLGQNSAESCENGAELEQNSAESRENSAELEQNSAGSRENLANGAKLGQNSTERSKSSENSAESRENSAKLCQNSTERSKSSENSAESRENGAKPGQNSTERSKSSENSAKSCKNRAEPRENRAEPRKNRAESCKNRAEPRENRNNGAKPKSNRKLAMLAVCVLVGFGAIWSLQTRDTPRVQSAVETANEVSPELAPRRAAESSREVVFERARKFPPTPSHESVPDSVREPSREKSVMEPADTTAYEPHATSRSKSKNEPDRPDNRGHRDVAQYPNNPSSPRKTDRLQRLRIDSLSKDLRAGKQ